LKYTKGLNGSEQLSEDEKNIILEVEEEMARKGNFIRAFPNPENVSYFE
jgi:hypothetical protein